MTSPGPIDLARLLRGAITAAYDRDGSTTPTSVGRLVGVSKSTMSRYVSPDPGKAKAAKPDLVRRIMRAVEADDEAFDDAVRLAEDLVAPRVVLLRPGSGTLQTRFHRLDQQAEHVCTFTTTLPPGLLQTEEYMRAIFVSAGQSPARVEANIAGRLARQVALDDPGRRYTQICTVGGLLWHAVSAEVMVGQMEAIARRARQDAGGRIRVGIVDRTQPSGIFPLTGFDLYDEREVVVGTLAGTAFIEWPQDVQRYVTQFEQLGAMAVWGAAAAAVVERIGAEYRAMIP